MVHAESHFIEIGITIVLSNGCPCVSEGVVAIIILFLHTHISANLSDAYVHVGIETVRIAIPLVEVKQVFVTGIRKILVKRRLNKWFNPHFNISFIPAAGSGFCPFVTNYTIMVIFFFQFINIHGIDTSQTKGQESHVST